MENELKLFKEKIRSRYQKSQLGGDKYQFPRIEYIEDRGDEDSQERIKESSKNKLDFELLTKNHQVRGIFSPQALYFNKRLQPKSQNRTGYKKHRILADDKQQLSQSLDLTSEQNDSIEQQSKEKLIPELQIIDQDQINIISKDINLGNQMPQTSKARYNKNKLNKNSMNENLKL